MVKTAQATGGQKSPKGGQWQHHNGGVWIKDAPTGYVTSPEIERRQETEYNETFDDKLVQLGPYVHPRK